MRAIIVDDEANSRSVLQELLSKNHPEVEVVASGGSVEEGYQLLQRYRPELVFLDIEMPDGLGFDLLQKVDNRHFQVIFTTAYEKYAITAIKFGALDYLLKPISTEELAEALQRVKARESFNISEEQIQILLETLRHLETKKLPTRIAVSTSKGIVYKRVKDIIRLKSDQNFTEIYISNNPRKLVASVSFGEYLSQFEHYPEFMKIHRCHLVNLNYVDKYVKGDSFLVMEDGAEISVPRSYREELLERLGRI